MSILRPLNQMQSVRKMEISLGSNALEQWFCFIPNFDQVRSPSKSAIDRSKNFFSEEDLQAAFQMLLQKAASAPENYDPLLETAMNVIGFEMPVNLLEVWYDGTCMATNIHFPTDWVQLGDCCKSLLKTIVTSTKSRKWLLEIRSRWSLVISGLEISRIGKKLGCILIMRYGLLPQEMESVNMMAGRPGVPM